MYDNVKSLAITHAHMKIADVSRSRARLSKPRAELLHRWESTLVGVNFRNQCLNGCRR